MRICVFVTVAALPASLLILFLFLGSHLLTLSSVIKITCLLLVQSQHEHRKELFKVNKKCFTDLLAL